MDNLTTVPQYVPLPGGKEPFDYVVSVLHSSRLTGPSIGTFVNLPSFNGQDHAELNELVVFSETATSSDRFALAIVSPGSSFAQGGGINQESVVLVAKYAGNQQSSILSLKTAVAKGEFLYFYTDKQCNVRISGKRVTS